MTALIEFAYETGDNSKGCQYWQDYVIVKSDTPIDFNGLEDLITSYMESDESDDKDYEDMTEEIMDTFCKGEWYFLDDRAVSINRTHTYWI